MPQGKKSQAQPRDVVPGRSALQCKCEVELNKDEPIITSAVGTDSPSADYRPNYTKEPKCDPEDKCEKVVTYEWTITPVEGKPKLSNDDKETATVDRPSTFKLCVKVMVKCKSRVIDSNTHAFRVSRCEDS